MTTERIVALAAAALVFFAAPALASAQHEPVRAEHVVVSTHGSHGPHLTDESEQLTPPNAGDYVLPVLGIIAGGVLVVGGALALFGSLLVSVGDSLNDRHSDTAAIYLGVGLGGLAVGAISIIASAVGIASLRHRQQASDEQVNLAGVSLAPVEGGVMASAWGTF